MPRQQRGQGCRTSRRVAEASSSRSVQEGRRERRRVSRKDFKSEGAMYTIVFRICQDVSKVSTDQERYGQNSRCPLRPQQRRNQYIQPVLSDSGFCPSDFGPNRASEVAWQTWNRPLGNCFEMPG